MNEIDLNNNNSNEIKETERNLIDNDENNNNLSEDTDEDCRNVIAEFTKIKRCSVLKYGVSLSTEKIKFGFCHTCDTNLMHPICLECIRECHIKLGHDTREIDQPDFILCGCGERMHVFLNNDKKKNKKFSSECPYSDWCEKSLLSTLYIINDKCICEFCYRMCGYEGKGRPLEKEREMLQVCECENLNGSTTHVDLKKIYHKLEEIIDNDNLILGIDPIKFINLLFLGKSSYESIFQNFEEMIQKLNLLNDNNKMILKDNFSSTNFYLSLNVFTKIVLKTKNNPMRYYNREIYKKISFDLISNLLNHINYYDNKIFWHFLNNMLYLYRKVNIGLKTMPMSKYKIRDFENFSPFQRKMIAIANSSVYPEAQTHIEFFIKYLNNLLNQDMKLAEACDVIIQICSILKRLSGFYLFSGFYMNSFCVILENIFQYLKHLKTYHRHIKLFSILIKIINYFIYNYNDNSFYNFVIEKKKEEDVSQIKFVFDKNELGRLISRSTIRILYYTISIRKLNKLNYKDNRTCENIIEYGTKILNLMISEKDNYFMNSVEKYLDIELFQKSLNISVDDEKYQKINDEVKNLEKCFSSFYSFDLDNKEVIRIANDSLEKIISLARANEIHPHLAKTNFFFIILKTLYICDLEEKEEEDLEDVDLIKTFVSNIFLFLQYFMEKNSGNALFICSFYVINSILKLPDIFIIEIFKLYTHCSDIISKKRGLFCNPKLIVKSLYRYLIKFKNESKNMASKEAQDFFMDGATILDQIIFIFLNIVIQLYLQTKLLYPYNSKEYLKKLLLDFLNNFNFHELMNLNACLILLLINRVFNSSDQIDRDNLIKLIPIQKLVLTLEYTSIDIDYRTQILIFLKLFKCSIYFKKYENKKENIKDVLENMKFESGKVKKTKKLKKIHHIKNKDKINEIDVNILFSLNDEEIQKNNNYLNAIGQNGDNFLFIKNNPLISNYKYPTKYLSFYYYFMKNEEIKTTEIAIDKNKNTKQNFKIAEASIDLFQKELKRFKDIFEKNTNSPNKMFRYLVKGIILPLCPLLKLLFCYTSDCNGFNILLIYQTIMKMMFIKIYIIDMSNSFLNEKKFPQFENFDINGFMDKKLQDQNLQDYYNLKDKKKFSPYDFTFIWDIFHKHFLSYITYPQSDELVNNYPSKELDYLSLGKLSEDTDLLDGINIFLRKKGNSLKRKVKSRASNNFILSTIENDKSKRKSLISMNRSYISNSKEQVNSINVDKEEIDHSEEEKKIMNQKIEKIYDFYSEEKINIDKDNSSLIISLAELCPEYEINFRKMLLTVLVNLQGDEMEYTLISRLIIYKLLIMTTDDTQNDISSLIGNKDKDDLGFISNLANRLYDYIIKNFIDDFNNDFMNWKDTHIQIFTINKILKYLCEEHNNYFQEKLLCYLEYSFMKITECKMISTHKTKFISRKNSKDSEDNEIETNISFFNFLVNVLDKILIVTNKVHNKGHIGYLFDIVHSIIELLIEIIQGNKKEILTKSKDDEIKNNMSLFSLQNFVSIVSEILLDDTLIEGYAFRTRLLLISFFIAILEEKTNEEIQKIIMKFLSLNKVMASINFTMKNYFYEKTKDDPKYQEYYSNYNEKQINQREFIFDYTVFSFFKYHYFHSNVSKESKEFELANNYYKYIKKLSINEKSPEAEELVKQINNLTEKEAKNKFSIFNKKLIKPNKIVPINLINEKEKSISITVIEHYYIVKFFEHITKVVEIRLPQEHRNVNVIFTIPYEMIHLTEMTKEEFVQNVDRNSENSKKFELIRSISLFQLEIQYFKNTKVSWISRLILRIDFVYVQFIMYFYALIFLLFMLATLEGYKGIKPIIEQAEERRIRLLLRNLIEIPNKILDAISVSINKWGQIYNYINYIFCGLNGILIIFWIAVKMPLYYLLDKYKYKQEGKIKENQLTFWNKASIMILDTIIGRDYITSLLYMFIISLIGSIMKRGEIIYAFTLLAILDLNQTLKGIAISIKLRGPELGASFLLLIFLVYFYSNLGFFYLNDNFAADIENDIPDNYCLCLSFCFMTNFDAGIRARGGAADQMIRISFERNTYLYLIRIIYDLSYFLICIIIMIDLVFGIILGTFSDMREKERKYDSDKINNCFICHITRETVEKRKEDFKFHRDKTHYLWNYVEYMIFLKFADIHDLNAMNSFARHNLDLKNICFLPSHEDNYEEGEDNAENEEDKKEEDEENEDSESDSDSNTSVIEEEENEKEVEEMNFTSSKEGYINKDEISSIKE